MAGVDTFILLDGRGGGGMKRFVVFECRKCGHNLYVENTDDIVKEIGKVSNSDCPSCGEEPDGIWVLVGLDNSFPYQREEGADNEQRAD